MKIVLTAAVCAAMLLALAASTAGVPTVQEQPAAAAGLNHVVGRSERLPPVQIMRKLAATHPRSPYVQRDLSRTLIRAGDLLAAQNDAKGALAAYRESLDITRKLTAQDPNNAMWKYDLMVSLNSVGNVLTAQGDHRGALLAYSEGLNIIRELVSTDPRNRKWERSLLLSENKVRDALAAPLGAMAPTNIMGTAR
jgi:tetratricopeptide (TPR) repeat protein